MHAQYLLVYLYVNCAHVSTQKPCHTHEHRYETTVGLPIEYGALNVGNVASGMLFYGEVHYPPPHNPAIHHILDMERERAGHKHGIIYVLSGLARPTFRIK